MSVGRVYEAHKEWGSGPRERREGGQQDKAVWLQSSDSLPGRGQVGEDPDCTLSSGESQRAEKPVPAARIHHTWYLLYIIGF